jgi:hypothetical protein
MPDNPGVSITSGVECLLRSLVDTFEGVLDLQTTMWVEHYPQCKAMPERFNRVLWDGTELPRWERLDYDLTIDLIERFGLKNTPWVNTLECQPAHADETLPGACEKVHKCKKEIRKRKVAYDRRLESLWKSTLPTLVLISTFLRDIPGVDVTRV